MLDIKQLKLILETIGETTESAKWALIIWLSVDILKLIVAWTGAIIIAKFIVTLTGRIISTQILGSRCRDAVLPEMAGTYITQSEANRVMETIHAGLKAKNTRP
jgi:hypothetical protein